MKANRVSATTLATLLLAACVSPAPPPGVPPASHPAPAPQPARPAAPLSTAAPADWRDAPQTPGTWRWSAASGSSTATYALPGQAARAALACDRATRRTILWTNTVLSAPTPMVITTTELHRVVTLSPVPSGGSAVSLPASDPLLDAIAFSRGRFMLETAGFAPLYLPAWPELSRVIEDCR